MTDHTIDTALESAHYQHLLAEGFKPEHIWSMEQKGVASISKSKALTMNFKIWSEQERSYQSSSGLYFPFTSNFGQIRCDTPLLRNGKPCKYLTPTGAKTQAYLPPGCKVITEGWKDAERPNQEGASIVTGAVAGVSHIKKAISQGSGQVVLFDSDGWRNPQVARDLLKAAIYLNSKIQLVPEIEGYPKGGLCEFFTTGHSVAEYEDLVANAMHPDEFLYEWSRRYEFYSPDVRAKCNEVALRYALFIGKAA